jgi:hypothetical protein
VSSRPRLKLLPTENSVCSHKALSPKVLELFETDVLIMWGILWNRLHIGKSFKSCWIKSCYTPPTKPRSALGETVPLWCATPCGNISAGCNCEPVKSATARATRGCRKPARKRGLGNRMPRGRKNSPRRGSALPVCRARQKTTDPRAHSRRRHRVFVHSFVRTNAESLVEE